MAHLYDIPREGGEKEGKGGRCSRKGTKERLSSKVKKTRRQASNPHLQKGKASKSSLTELLHPSPLSVPLEIPQNPQRTPPSLLMASTSTSSSSEHLVDLQSKIHSLEAQLETLKLEASSISNTSSLPRKGETGRPLELEEYVSRPTTRLCFFRPALHLD